VREQWAAGNSAKAAKANVFANAFATSAADTTQFVLVRVQFPTPIGLSDYLADIANSGFVQYIPHDTFVVTMDTWSLEKARKHHGVVDIFEFPSSMKIDPSLTEYVAASMAAFSGVDADRNKRTTGDKSKSETGKSHVLYAMLAHGGPEWEDEVDHIAGEWRDLFQQRNIAASIELASHSTAVLKVSGAASLKAAVGLLAQHPRVHWMQEYREIALRNKQAGLSVQSCDAKRHTIWHHGIRGAGQIVGIADTGIDHDNCFFRDSTMPIPPQCSGLGHVKTLGCINHTHRKIVTYRKFATSDYQDYQGGHGTHVVGSVAGSVANADTAELALAQEVLIRNAVPFWPVGVCNELFARRCLCCLHAFLATALSRVVRAAVPIPAVASVSVLHSAAAGGFDASVVGPL